MDHVMTGWRVETTQPEVRTMTNLPGLNFAHYTRRAPQYSRDNLTTKEKKASPRGHNGEFTRSYHPPQLSDDNNNSASNKGTTRW